MLEKPRRRREALRDGAGLAFALATGCGVSAGAGTVPAAEVYVALARAQAVAVLDAATDRVRRRVSLSDAGRRGHLGQIRAGPYGLAAVLPLVNAAAEVGIVVTAADPGAPAEGDAAGARLAAPAAAAAAPEGEEGPEQSGAPEAQPCTWLDVGAPDPDSVDSLAAVGAPPFGAAAAPAAPAAAPAAPAAQTLVADARGAAYVLVGDSLGLGPTYVAVVDLEAGSVRRHLPLAAAGERVFALAAHPDGERLYAGIWRWDTGAARGGGWGGAASGNGWSSRGGAGRLVALETQRGELRARAGLPDASVVTDLALAAPPPGRGGGGDPPPGALALYAVVTNPGPARSEDGEWWPPAARSTVVALDPRGLDLAAAWPLEPIDARPSALAVPKSGTRAYLLAGPAPETGGTPSAASAGGVGSRRGRGRAHRLLSLDLAAGRVVHRWAVPAGCAALAVGPGEKVYAADPLGDRLWRVDGRADRFLGAMPLPGAPIAVAVPTTA